MKRLSLLAALTLVVPMLLFAAPPINDAFDAPSVLSGFPTTTIGTNIDATLETGEPVGEEWDKASVWFRWISPVTGPVQIDTLGSDFDTELAVWNGNALSNLTFLVGNDDYEGSQSAVFIAAISGVTYQISVYGYDDARGVIKLNITNDVTSHISGRVTGPDGIMPLQGIQATAYRWSDSGWDWIQAVDTDANGNYTIGGLPAGTYRVEFNDWQNGDYLSEVYDNVSDWDSGTDIVVAAETTVTDIDASLGIASKISGRVTGPDGIMPIQGIQATAYRWTGSWWDWMQASDTDANGDYIIGGLLAGTYRVQFEDWENGDYASCVYDNASNLDSGTDIVLAAETVVTGIDASLANASKISGRVTGPDGSTPLEGIEVSAYHWVNSYGDWGDYVYTDVNGDYTFGGLPAGTYRVQFYDSTGGYIYECYDNAADLNSGTDIVVATETTVTGIDASLSNVVSLEPRFVGLRQTGVKDWELLYIGDVGEAYILQKVASLTDLWEDEGESFLCQPGTNAISRESFSPVLFWRLRTFP